MITKLQTLLSFSSQLVPYTRVNLQIKSFVIKFRIMKCIARTI